MRKQGDNAVSIPKRRGSSPGLRLGACMRRRINPRLAPGGFHQEVVSGSPYGNRLTFTLR